MTDIDYGLGCRLPLDQWVWLNRTGVFDDPTLRKFVSPFPPPELMENVSGLTSERDFASHGADFFIALSEASPRPLTEYGSILDFGCGCGRLARMFKGHPHKVAGCDIDRRHVDWVNRSLGHVQAKLSSVRPPIPYDDDEFDAVISISSFTHLNESAQDEFLSELHRVCQPNGTLFLTVHGQKALSRAINEQPIRDMIAVPDEPFRRAQALFAQGKHAFILQQGHLTTVDRDASSSSGRLIDEPFEYGITFIPEPYIREHWGKWFHVLDYRHGGIHAFQDIVVLTPKK